MTYFRVAPRAFFAGTTNVSSPLKRLLIVTAVAVLCTLIAVEVKVRYLKTLSYEGQVVSLTRKVFYDKRGRVDHYMDVQTSGGKTRKVFVPHALWKNAKVGDSVRKIPGELYPKLVSANKVE